MDLKASCHRGFRASYFFFFGGGEKGGWGGGGLWLCWGAFSVGSRALGFRGLLPPEAPGAEIVEQAGSEGRGRRGPELRAR